MLDYEYFKNHYKLIAVDLSKQKELDADPRAIHQIEFYGMLKTTKQTIKLRNAIENNMSADIKLSKAQISRIIQSGGFLDKLGPLLKTGLPLIKNGIKPLAKSVSIPLGLTAAASAADTGIQKKLGSGTRTLIISIEEMNDIMKIVQALEDSNILLKGITKTIKMKQKNKKEAFYLCYETL